MADMIFPYLTLFLLIPVLFLLLGNSFTKNHCKTYFNVVITAAILYLLGYAVDFVLSELSINLFSFSFVVVGLIYLAIMSIIGLIKALSSDKYKTDFCIRLL